MPTPGWDMSSAQREGVSLTVTGNHCNVVLLHRGLREAGGVAGEGRCLQVLLFRRPGLVWVSLPRSPRKRQCLRQVHSTPSACISVRCRLRLPLSTFGRSTTTGRGGAQVTLGDENGVKRATPIPRRQPHARCSRRNHTVSRRPSGGPALDRVVINAPLPRTRRSCECGSPEIFATL
jgi:hypothetical protein